MKSGILIISAIAIALIGGLAIRATMKRNTARETRLSPAYQQPSNFSRIQQPRTVSVTAEPASAAISNSMGDVAVSGNVSNAAIQTASSGAPGKEPLKDPFARVALIFVGTDPDAEAYWFAAINDPDLPANERQDLIEDLNEEGLPDPEHPTLDDLPLIFNRLALIETIGPDAADSVNADAFKEAYKDLLNLAQLAMGGGEPVK
jgi:hypothetical protein